MPYKNQPSRKTYYLQGPYPKDALTNIAQVERMITGGLSGALLHLPEPTIFQRVLDVGCGTGSWAIAAAQAYPTMSLVGVDFDEHLVNYARGEAATAHVADRVEFLTMDALLGLAFPEASFDLVNLRLGASFIRSWEWPRLLSDMVRVTRPRGTLCITELETLTQSSSSALVEVSKILTSAFFRSGHFFEQAPTGITAHLQGLLRQYACRQVHTKATTLKSRAGTAEGQTLLENMVHAFQAMSPFIQKWGWDTGKYAWLCQQALHELQQSDSYATWEFLTAWGNTD